MNGHPVTGETASPEAAFLHKLRTDTAALHAGLEAQPVSHALMAEAVSLDDYARYLACMQDVMKFYDGQVLPLIAALLPDAARRQKSADLQRDLDYLRSKGAQPGSTVALAAPSMQDEAFALGMAYVIEGSTLGGRVILKHIMPRLNVDENNGAAFFAGYQAGTGNMWKVFLDVLMAQGAGAHGDRIIEGALAGFGMIDTHFRNNAAR